MNQKEVGKGVGIKKTGQETKEACHTIQEIRK